MIKYTNLAQQSNYKVKQADLNNLDMHILKNLSSNFSYHVK